MTEIVYLSLKEGTPAKGYWDQAFIGDIFESLSESDRTVVVIPGAYQADKIVDINTELIKYKKVFVVITSDEEGKFPIGKLSHPDMYVYGQYGTSLFNIPLGYTPQTRKELKRIGYVQDRQPWFFAGQINHIRRHLMADVLNDYDSDHDKFYPTNGFAQGLEPWQYFDKMASACAVPCPPGNETQDSFRVYEALESGAVPIVDRFSAQGNFDYWDPLFPDAPFPIISSYQELIPAIEKAQNKAYRNQVFAWWIAKKMEWRQQFKEKLGINEAMTIVVPTSPIKSHPSTEIIDQTIASIRHHTMQDIIITIDGIRPEQEHVREAYEEYISRLLWKCNFEYENVIPLVFKEHVHQSGMMREALKYVKTPLVMYVEHDTPLVTDEQIDWAFISKTLLRADANVVRFHYEAFIPEEHKYLLVPDKNIPFLSATKQWSQRPHVARTDFYKEIMRFFSPESNCFIEDRIYGQCVEGNWDDWKLFIYTPPGSIKRSLNLDGRGGDVKYEKEQIW